MSQSRNRLFICTLMTAFTIFFAVDIYSDVVEGAQLRHILFELAFLIVAFFASLVLATDYLRIRQQAIVTSEQLRVSHKKVEEFGRLNESLVKGVAGAIDRQFTQWRLSPSEREIALLIVKGLSLKEISEIRQSSERTVRSQTTAIYQKSGLPGRAGLSAFFLEDLLDI